jgi:hypothetical protein
MSHPDDERISRRENLSAMLGILGGAVGVSTLNGCDGPRSGQTIGITKQALSGSQFLWVDTIAGSGTNLRGIVGSDTSSGSNPTIIVGGYSTPGDGGGGLFYWDTTSSTGDNGGTIIVPTGSSSGRWKRIYSGSIDVRWFGATSASDLGAIVNTCDTALGSAAGEIYVPPGDYAIKTIVTLSAGHKLRLGKGHYTTGTFGLSDAPFHMNDNTEICGEGWATIVDNAPSGTIILATGNVNNAGNTNIAIRDLQFLGGNDRNPDANSTISLGNAKSSIVERIWLNGTAGLGVSLGESSLTGYHCEDCWIKDCLFTDTYGSATNVVNATGFHIVNNTFRNLGAGVNPSYACDCEPNTSSDLLQNFEISGNTIDGSGTNGQGILLQGGTLGPGVVANNTILGGSNEQFNVGITWNGAQDVMITGNVFKGTFNPNQAAFVSSRATRCVFANNYIIGSGESGTDATVSIVLSNTTYCVFFGNHIFSDPSSVYGRTKILEGDGCDFNYYHGNYLQQNQGNSGPSYDPHIQLSGQNSRAWNNVMAGRMRQGASEQTRRKVSANANLLMSDQIVGVDTTGGPVTLTLPNPTTTGRVGGYDNGSQVFLIQDEGGSAAANNITIQPYGTEKINGTAAARLLSTNWGRLTFYTDGTDWFVS